MKPAVWHDVRNLIVDFYGNGFINVWNMYKVEFALVPLRSRSKVAKFGCG
jgi:hypothetical protein